MKGNGGCRVPVQQPEVGPFELRQSVEIHARVLLLHPLLQFLKEEVDVVLDALYSARLPRVRSAASQVSSTSMSRLGSRSPCGGAPSGGRGTPPMASCA